jgi:hypothetical protein
MGFFSQIRRRMQSALKAGPPASPSAEPIVTRRTEITVEREWLLKIVPSQPAVAKTALVPETPPVDPAPEISGPRRVK